MYTETMAHNNDGDDDAVVDGNGVDDGYGWCAQRRLISPDRAYECSLNIVRKLHTIAEALNNQK